MEGKRWNLALASCARWDFDSLIGTAHIHGNRNSAALLPFPDKAQAVHIRPFNSRARPEIIALPPEQHMVPDRERDG